MKPQRLTIIAAALLLAAVSCTERYCSIKRLVIFIFSFCLIFSSCGKIEPRHILCYQTNHVVSIDIAETEVLSLIKCLEKSTKGAFNAREIEDAFSLSGSYSIDSTQRKPLIHVFNFIDNQGFAIAAGDDRMPPVFCITESGHIDRDLTISLPEGVAIMLSIIEDEYSGILGTRENPGDSLDVDPTVDPPTVVGTDIIYTEWETSSVYGSRIQSKWDQGYPFNKYCVSGGDTCKVGCVAVAVGQLMYYWGVNTTYNGHSYDWSEMHNVIDSNTSQSYYSSAWDQVQHMLSDLGRSENLNVDYGVSSSSANCNKITRTLENFGFAHGGTKSSYSDIDIKNEIWYGRPVIAGGYSHDHMVFGIHVYYTGGHEWLFDQYYTIRRTGYVVEYYSDGSSQVIETRQYGRNYYHCNWGWNGLYNGFYLSGLFDAENGAGIVTRANSKSDHDHYYQYDLDIHTGINPLQ